MAIEAGKKIRSWRFHIYLETTNGRRQLGCNSVPEISSSLEERDINDGKANRLKGYADAINLSEFTIERGKDANQYLYNWFCLSREVARTNGRVLAGNFKSKYNGQYKRMVDIVSPESNVWAGLRAQAIGARPIEYTIEEFDAETSDILFESVKFRCKGIHFDKRTEVAGQQ